jgi:hypothetical protein
MSDTQVLPHTPATHPAARLDAPTTDPSCLFDLAEGMHAIDALTASLAWLHLCQWLLKERRPSQ